MPDLILKTVFRIVLVLGLALSSGQAMAAKHYQVTAQFFHLGELIASPQLEVEEGEAVAGTWTVRGSPRYKIVVKVNPATATQVYTSLQFVSGSIDIQPNLLVEVGETAEATINNVKVVLLVENWEPPQPDA